MEASPLFSLDFLLGSQSVELDPQPAQLVIVQRSHGSNDSSIQEIAGLLAPQVVVFHLQKRRFKLTSDLPDLPSDDLLAADQADCLFLIRKLRSVSACFLADCNAVLNFCR